MYIDEFLGVFHKFHAAGTSLELVSGPGLGKSSAMHAGCANLSRDAKQPVGCYTMICSGMDPADVRGFLFPIKNEDGSLHARFTRPTVFPSPWNVDVYVDGVLAPGYNGPVPDLGVLFFDELGQSEIEVQKPLGQVMLDKRMGEYRIPPGWVVWAASNRLEDRSGVVKTLAFLQNRRKTINIEPSYAAWEDWAMRAGVHPLVISFAKAHPDHVFRSEIPSKPGPFCTPRSLVLCANDLMMLRGRSHGEDRLPDDKIALEVVQGWLGEGTQPTFMSHIRLANDLPSVEDVLRDPMKTKIPERPDARYVMAMSLAHHLTKKNGGAFLKYMSRMDKEIQILFVTNAIRRTPEALNVPEFQKWTEDNKDLAMIAFG